MARRSIIADLFERPLSMASIFSNLFGGQRPVSDVPPLPPNRPRRRSYAEQWR